jgi:HAD superfamily hydrolase (TIGR01509 family)
MTRRTYAAVICDMDGLLIDSECLYKEAWQTAGSGLGITIDGGFYESLIGITEARSEQRLLEEFGRDFPLADFRAAWRAIWRELMAAGRLEAKAGAAAILEDLRASPARLALATSSGRSYAQESLEHCAFDNYFEHIVAAEDACEGKPAPDLYLEAARRLGILPSQCLVLEDSPTGALAGLAAGMVVMIVPDLQPVPPTVAARAAGVFDSLVVARPHVLAGVGCA